MSHERELSDAAIEAAFCKLYGKNAGPSIEQASSKLRWSNAQDPDDFTPSGKSINLHWPWLAHWTAHFLNWMVRLLQRRSPARTRHEHRTRSGHPEDTCEECGRDNVTWFAPSPIWNAVVRKATEEREPMLCPVCFIRRAERGGILPPAWEVRPESVEPPVSSEGTGREPSEEIIEIDEQGRVFAETQAAYEKWASTGSREETTRE